MGFFLTLLLWTGLFAVSKVIQPRPPRRRPEDARALTLDEVGLTATEGRSIPVVMGTRLVRSVNLVWYGNLSTTAIVQSGVTTGYKYYLGAHYGVCMGPATRIVELRFNEKPVGTGITAANQGIVFAASGSAPWKTATVLPEHYTNAELARAMESAIKLAEPGDWRVGYGYTIEAGVNDELRYMVTGAFTTSGLEMVAKLKPGDYATGSAFATEIARALNEVEATRNDPDLDGIGSFDDGIIGTFTCIYTGSFTFRIDINDSLVTRPVGYTTWKVKPSTGLFMLGFRHSQTFETYVGPGGVLESGYATKPKRFIFSYGGTTAALHATDAGFTIATTIGLNTGADKTGLGIAITDSDFTTLDGTVTDQGDFIQFDVNAPTFFGTEGGIVGRVDVYKGGSAQAASSYLTAQFLTQAPGYPYLVHLVLRAPYIGDSAYPPAPSVVVECMWNSLGLTDGKENISGDINPAAAIYELATNTVWGLGMPTAQMDTAAFLAAAETLFTERFGVSIELNDPQDAEEHIREILKHVDGIYYADPYTGLIGIRLVRPGYDPAMVPVLDEDNVLDVVVRRGAWDDSKNVVKVRYVDRVRNYTERVKDVYDLSNIQARGGDQAVEEIAFPYLTTEANAQRVADRTLIVLSGNPAELEITMNREAWAFRPGDPCILNWPAGQITNMPIRIVNVRNGEIGEDTIVLDASQDLTGEPWPLLSGNLSGWGYVWGYDWGGLP